MRSASCRSPLRSCSTLLLITALLAPLGACQVASVTDDEAPHVFALMGDLAQRRADNIERLRAYRIAGTYPRNRVLPVQANVFIDEDDHLCAVANLMWLDGQTDLVADVADTNNLVVLRDVHDGPLYDWILASGLTQEEVARIQEPYMPFDPNDPNFSQNEDDRLDQHFVVVEQELQANNAAAILEAARRQRAEIVARR